MKHILLFLLFSCAAGAQNLSDADLKGTWALSTVKIKGMLLDFEKGTVTVLEGHEGEFSQQMLERLEQSIKSGQHSFAQSYTFTKRGEALEQLKDIKYVRSYSLYREAGKDYIRFAKDPFEIRLEGNQMTLIIIDSNTTRGMDSEIIYKRS